LLENALMSKSENTLAPWPAFVAREGVLHDLEKAIATNPAALDTRFYYASFLRDHGRLDDAIAAFDDILVVAPEHVETLIALGVVLARRGRRLDARAVFERAVALAGGHLSALVNLANVLALDETDRAGALYEKVLQRDPGFVAAHRGLCSLAAAHGDATTAARHRNAGYAAGPFGRRPYFGQSMPATVLACVSTDGGNIPLAALLDEHRFLVNEVYVEAYRGEPLPPHTFIVNAIGDADRSPAALECAAQITNNSRVPVINAPRAVAATTRVANAARLGQVAGVVAPAARTLGRDALAINDFPVILRAPGLHMGRGMIRADDAHALAGAAQTFSKLDELIAIQYVDTRSTDGAWRKYRVMAIDGALYPLHLAIAHRWDVHYFSAAMADRADYRAEEARFLDDPATVLGSQAWDTLGRVRDTLGLDYAGIDFALAGDGRIVVFEANAAMTVLHPDPDPRFAYRKAASDAIAAALVRMFEQRIA
jgi:tetratricopeptide (TPR) repeat protein